MYRPHAAIEDAALFASLRTAVPENAYRAMEEELEERATALLGPGGHEAVAERVSEMERELGIDELSQFM